MEVNGLVKQAQAQIHEVSPTAVAGRLEEFLVLDVREPQEVLYGYLPGAINVARGTIEFRVSDDNRFREQAQAILVYSSVGKRSALAAVTLNLLGFSNVHSLAGGIRRWSRENLPVE